MSREGLLLQEWKRKSLNLKKENKIKAEETSAVIVKTDAAPLIKKSEQ